MFEEIPSWRPSNFIPGKSGIESVHQGLDKGSLWRRNCFSHESCGIEGDRLELDKIPSWQREGFSPRNIEQQELYKEGLNASLQGILTGGTMDYMFDYHEWGPLKFTDAPRRFHGDINISTENTMFGTAGLMPMSLLTINSVTHLWLKRMQWSASADCLCFKAKELKRTYTIVRQWDLGIKQIGFCIFLLKWCAIEMLWMLLPWSHSCQLVYIPDYMLKPRRSSPLLGFSCHYTC